MKEEAGFIVLKGNLFNNAVMKTSVIGEEFRARYLSDPKDPEAFEGRAVVFEGPEDYHHRIDDPALKIDERCMLFIRGTGPIGYPGGAEVVNMQPPAYLIKKGVHALPCIGDGRQSGTSGSPSILNASPEAAVLGGLALVCSGDRLRIDLAGDPIGVAVGVHLAGQRGLEQRHPEGQVDRAADGHLVLGLERHDRAADHHVLQVRRELAGQRRGIARVHGEDAGRRVIGGTELAGQARLAQVDRALGLHRQVRAG